MKAVASINARMGSTRLPGKVLMDIDGVPLLTRIVRRLRYCTALDGIILATTTNPKDDVLVDWANDEGIPSHRGSEEDVLKRTVEAHLRMQSEIVVRVCGDTPLIDPAMIDLGVRLVREDHCDIAMASAERKFPHGTTAHVCKLSDLMAVERILDKGIIPSQSEKAYREHVTLYLYDHDQPEYRFRRVYKFQGMPEWKCEGQRLQVDYQEDLDVVRIIQERLGGDSFGIGEIVDLLKREPWIRGLNAHCEEKPVR